LGELNLFWNAYFFGPNITSKKVWVPRFQKKMYEFQKKKFSKKRNSYFLGPNIVPKKVRVPKKI
jgi:hypothetical protein